MTDLILPKNKVTQQDIIKEIAIYWHIDEVKNVRPDLTDAQASDILIHLQKNHDADQGINWGVIECVADLLFPMAST